MELLDIHVMIEEPEEGERKVIEISAYPVSDGENGRVTDTMTTLAVVVIPTPDMYHVDAWYETDDETRLRDLPESVLEGFNLAVEIAKNGEDRRFKVGDRVYLKSHRMPAEIQAYSTDGAYWVELANTGVYDWFDEVSLAPFDSDRWYE